MSLPPNRILDLTELQRPEFRRIVDQMERYAAREAVSYLHPSKRWEYPWALEQAGLTPGARVLDAGCGASIFPIYLAAAGYRVCACDLGLPGRLDRLHEVDVGYLGADLCHLPLAAESFDTVFCISVLEHLPRSSMPAALAQMHRVLRPGGRLLLTTDYWRDASEELWYTGEGRSFRVDWNVFDEALLRRLVLAASGFRVMGEIDLNVDWERTAASMRDFHGYPYTAVGIVLQRSLATKLFS